jgi:hypothetical protein
MSALPKGSLSVLPADDDGCRMDVPWEAADDLQAFFQRQGVLSTLFLDPRQREARLELRGVSAERAEVLLEELPI